MFSGENVAEADDGELLWNPQPLAQEGVGGADGDEVIDRLHGGGFDQLVHHLESGFSAFVDRAARLENQAIVPFDLRFAQRTAIAFQPFLRVRGEGRPGQKSDPFVPQLDQVFRQ